MIFTLTRNLTFAQAGQILMARYERAQSRLYRKVMKRLKAVMKKPIVKVLIKFNAALERVLKITMRCAHRVEKTTLFRFGIWCTNALILSVRKDGLKFTILLTTLGYTAWCYFI